MTVRELIQFAVQKANLGRPEEINSDLYEFALSALNASAEDIYKAHNWDNAKILNLTMSTDEAVILLPKYVDYVQAVRINTTALFAKDEILLNYINPESFDSDATGTPTQFIHLPYAAVETQPEDYPVVVTTTTFKDINRTIRVEGLVGDNPVSETFTVTSLEQTQLSNIYSKITGISKEKTFGTITFKNSNNNDIIATLLPNEDRTAYRRIELQPPPSELVTVYILAKRKFMWLSSDYDVFPIDKAENALRNMLVAELLEYDQKPDVARIYRQAALIKLREAISDDTTAKQTERKLVPLKGMWSLDEE